VDYDLICVGGGLAGAALGRALAQRGRRVLVVEREPRFRDRVRGEYLEAWGVVEARALGLEATLLGSGACEVPRIAWWVGGAVGVPVDVRQASPAGAAPLCLSHPAMQEALLEAARDAGADVLRPARVTAVMPGAKPAVELHREDGSSERHGARLVIGADGRDSRLRSWGAFRVERDPEKLALAGLLLDGYAGPADTASLFWNFAAGEEALLFPRGGGRLRAYVAAGVPADWLEDATTAGPLAAFQGADAWVPHPHHDGVALVGDAAATSDPTWGCGLSLTLRDVRVLRDELLARDDWALAADAYAREHDRYYARLHTIEGWLTDVFFDLGPEADARRERILARALGEPDRVPDIVAHGPDAPCDEAARRRCFAED
jgi:2-polyprenyl-6-methoxyphenol hydroxylase-like FAD-dependent oxidoreductase